MKWWNALEFVVTNEDAKLNIEMKPMFFNFHNQGYVIYLTILSSYTIYDIQ